MQFLSLFLKVFFHYSFLYFHDLKEYILLEKGLHYGVKSHT